MKVLLLQTIDTQWKDHLLSIDHLKEGIGMRAYGQRNPKEEYKREAYALFMEMMGRIRQEVAQKLFRVQLAREDEVSRMEEEQRRERLALTRQSGPAAGSPRNRPGVMPTRLAATMPVPAVAARNTRNAAGSRAVLNNREGVNGHRS